MRGDRKMRAVRGEAEADGSREQIFLDLTGVSVLVMMPTTRDLPPQTVYSLLETQRIALEHDIRVRMLIEPGASSPSLARSICIHRFLYETPDLTKAFWIDSDMEWDGDAFMRMVALSTKYDVVVGAYSQKQEPLHFMLNTPGPVRPNELGCIPAASGGLGFTICDRRVIEVLAERSPRRRLSVQHELRE